jgi:hypothetical protein
MWTARAAVQARRDEARQERRIENRENARAGSRGRVIWWFGGGGIADLWEIVVETVYVWDPAEGEFAIGLQL